MIFGELADGALLASQHVTPRVALSAGYRFRYSDVQQALNEVFSAASAGSA
jgi:NAD dependent epimerase/dehydratase family enzyme